MAARVCTLAVFLAALVAGCVSKPLPPSQAKVLGALAGCVRATEVHRSRNQTFTSLCAANAFYTKSLIGVTRSEVLKFVGRAGSDAHVGEMSFPLTTVGAGSVGGPVVLTLHFGSDQVVDSVALVAVQ